MDHSRLGAARRLPHRPVALPPLEARRRRRASPRLTLDVAEDGGIRPGYKLKLNTYDLGVDIELARRAATASASSIPRCARSIVTSAKDRIFCSGANIFMLGVSSHAWKVNFCKFTNETRNGIEDSSPHSGLKFVAAVNGACAGGGYELALACDEIVLVDDRSSSVSLPEVPLLGVLPGTGGLTRVTDKRKVRHDLADIFCTSVEGVRGQRARRLAAGRRGRQAGAVRRRGARARARSSPTQSDRPADAQGRRAARRSSARTSADAHPLRARRRRPSTARAAPRRSRSRAPQRRAAGRRRRDRSRRRRLVAAGDGARARRRDPARCAPTSSSIGTWILKTEGDAAAVLAVDARCSRSTRPLVRARDDRHAAPHASRGSTSRRARLFALIEPGSCFAGTLLELALRRRPHLHAGAARRRRHARRSSRSTRSTSACCRWSTARSRLQRRFYDEAAPLDAARARDRHGARRRRGARARPRHRGARRHRLGRRDPHRARGARRACRPTR